LRELKRITSENQVRVVSYHNYERENSALPKFKQAGILFSPNNSADAYRMASFFLVYNFGELKQNAQI